MNKGEIDLIQIVLQFQEFPILNVSFIKIYQKQTSLLLDVCFYGFQLGQNQRNQEELDNIIVLMQEINHEIQTNNLALDEKANIYTQLICQNELKQSAENIRQMVMPTIQFRKQATRISQSEIVQNECSICLEKMPLYQLFALSNCTHIYHKNCLTELVKNKTEFPIICPHPGCQKDILPEDLREIADRETLQKLDQYTFNSFLTQNADKLFHCPTQGCTVVVEQIGDQFTCPLCALQYCRKCKQLFHQGECGDDQFMQLANEKKLKQCSKCKQWVEKNQGCDHMTCRCKHQFCYICGGDWGKCFCKK